MLVVMVSNLRAQEHAFDQQRKDARPPLACAGVNDAEAERRCWLQQAWMTRVMIEQI